MAMAHVVAERSTCDRLRAGSVLVKDRRIIATGYNGSPSGLDHCDDVGHLMYKESCIRTLHGEENALLQAAAFGVSTQGAELYTTFSPCYNCLKKLIACGIKRIVAGAYFYRHVDLLEQAVEQAHITFEVYTPDPQWWKHLSEHYASLPNMAAEQPLSVPKEPVAQQLSL